MSGQQSPVHVLPAVIVTTDIMRTLNNSTPAVRRVRLTLFLFFAFLLVRPAAAQTERITYDVISIKRHAPDAPRSGNDPLNEGGRLRLLGVQLSILMTAAFRAPGAPHQLKRSQIIGLPSWADTELYDVEAKPEPGFVPTYDQTVAMIRALLEDRFALKTHRETRDESVFALVFAKDGIDGKKGIRLSSDQTPIKGTLGRRSVRSASGGGVAIAEAWCVRCFAVSLAYTRVRLSARWKRLQSDWLRR